MEDEHAVLGSDDGLATLVSVVAWDVRERSLW
jgi:hypothetical protein